MHLLLMIPSSLLLVLMFLHSWRYRGRNVTIAFFSLCLGFGILRGNTIYYIITQYLGGDTLPYLFLRPVVRIGNASIQECIGWIFALYLCWSTVEWVLARQGGRQTIGLYRLIGLTGFLMGAVAYAVEAAAVGVKWWVWVFPIKNPFFADTPFVGIVAWVSVAIDFLAIFLLIRHRVVRGWWIAPLVLLFPVHMLTHLKLSEFSAWLPLSPNEIWYWASLALLAWGVAVDGPQIVPWTAAADADKTKGNWRRWALHVALIGFILVLASVHFVIIGSPDLAVSLVPFLVGVLFFRPLYAAVFLAASCLLAGFGTGEWSYTIVPAATFVIFLFGSNQAVTKLSFPRRREIVLAGIGLATVWTYYVYFDRHQRYETLTEIQEEFLQATTTQEIDLVIGKLPQPGIPDDAFHLNQLGVKLNKKGHYSAARRLLETATECDSTYAYAWFNLGWAYRGLNNYEASIRCYRRGLELNPIDYDSILILGDIFSGLGRLKDAEDLFRRTLGYNPNRTNILLALESVLYRTGRVDEAIELLKKRLPDTDDPRSLASRLAADLFKAGRSAEAIPHYQQVIRENAEQIYAAALSVALIYWQDQKQPAKALEYVGIAVRVQPSADVYSMMGAILEELGKKDGARSAYRMADSLANK
ncbi:MAG: tetratricopeptide repeat protein [Candidatus Glassbacteria bacterium]